jgi:F420-dependent oxidoreductase-like protein
MRFSIWPSPAQPWDDIHQIAAHCERSGWDGVYFADHFMPNGPGPAPLDGDTLECWSVLAALAAVVPRVRLAPLVTSVTYRHPAVLANIAAAVDQIAHGRLTLGIGAGWQENEHAAYGIALGTVRERMDRFSEAVQILRSLLGQSRTTFAGQYFQLDDASCQPAPVQDRLPLLIGGSGERRTIPIAARYADQWNAWTTPELLAHKVSVLRANCDQVGRDPGEIHVSTQALLFLSTDKKWLDEKRQAAVPGRPVMIGTPGEVAEIVAQYRDAGADELIIPDSTLGSASRKQDTCDLFMQEVAPAFR